MGLKPWELYDLDLSILGEMILANMKVEEESFDTKMQMVAWQTALLMNSSGNFKKKIKPEDLYTPLAEAKKKEKQQEFNPEEKKRLQDELLSAFAGSNVVTK